MHWRSAAVNESTTWQHGKLKRPIHCPLNGRISTERVELTPTPQKVHGIRWSSLECQKPTLPGTPSRGGRPAADHAGVRAV